MKETLILVNLAPVGAKLELRVIAVQEVENEKLAGEWFALARHEAFTVIWPHITGVSRRWQACWLEDSLWNFFFQPTERRPCPQTDPAVLGQHRLCIILRWQIRWSRWGKVGTSLGVVFINIASGVCKSFRLLWRMRRRRWREINRGNVKTNSGLSN